MSPGQWTLYKSDITDIYINLPLHYKIGCFMRERERKERREKSIMRVILLILKILIIMLSVTPEASGKQKVITYHSNRERHKCRQRNGMN